jgi:hypothetical protein
MTELETALRQAWCHLGDVDRESLLFHWNQEGYDKVIDLVKQESQESK